MVNCWQPTIVHDVRGMWIYLTLMLLEPKVISLCHQASLHFPEARPGSILLADQLQVLILISLKKWSKDSSRNGRRIIPFKKFSKLRVNFSFYKHLKIHNRRIVLNTGNISVFWEHGHKIENCFVKNWRKMHD